MPPAGSITIVPSVHYSATHRHRVRETIREHGPDIVAVELDEWRFERIDRDHRRTAADLIREMGPGFAVAYRGLRALQETVVRLSGLDPESTDMETAIETAAEIDADIALIDEHITETVSLLSRQVGLETIPRFLNRARKRGLSEQYPGVEVLPLQFEDITSGADVEPLIDELRWLFPELATVLIDRRDETMAKRLHALKSDGYDVVAVVGAGHHLGIERLIADYSNRDEPIPIHVPLRQSSRSITRIPIE